MENKKETKKSDIHIKIKKVEDYNDLTECSICYTQYDDYNHLPLILTCGHTIC